MSAIAAIILAALLLPVIQAQTPAPTYTPTTPQQNIHSKRYIQSVEGDIITEHVKEKDVYGNGKNQNGYPGKKSAPYTGPDIAKYLKSAKDMSAIKKEQRSFARQMSSIIERTKENLDRSIKGLGRSSVAGNQKARKVSGGKR